MTAPSDRRLRPPGPRGAGWRRPLLVGLGVATVLAAGFVAARVTTRTGSGARVIVLHAYSALDEVLSGAVLPAFADAWTARTGERLHFATTYEGSGALCDRILRGEVAEVAILASAMDAARLAPSVVPPASWEALPHRGVLARTPVVLVVREGNPAGIHDFADLAAQDLAVIRPDPRTSGLGAWSILAVYGAGRRASLSHKEALARVFALEATSLPPAISARAASRCFRLGTGDACFAYAHDVAPTPARPAPPGEVVRPRSTILCEPVVVVIDREIPPADREMVDAFVRYLWSAEAQATLVAYGLLPAGADPSAAGIEDPFTLRDLGGPEAARRQVLDALRQRSSSD